jgi:hypothetical protein
MQLQCAFGKLEVEDGNLAVFAARHALISGLCGDLALAIHDQTGAKPYFVTYGYSSDAPPTQLMEDYGGQADYLYSSTTHALVESPTVPGHFVDAYGQKSAEELRAFYGDDVLLMEGNREMLMAYSTGIASTLQAFAAEALRMDEAGESFDYLAYGD